MLLGRSWGARGPLLSVLKPDFGRFWAFLCACCVRRFSLNALSVPPLGQVQDQFETVSDGFETGSRRVQDSSEFKKTTTNLRVAATAPAKIVKSSKRPELVSNPSRTCPKLS